MQNKIEIKDSKLIVEPQGIDKLATLKDKIEIPLNHIISATIDLGILDESKGWKAPGTVINGYWGGTFTKNGEKSFFNIKRGVEPLVIQLSDEKFTRLVLGVDDPKNMVNLINDYIEK